MGTRARVEIGPKGRIVIPVAVRDQLGLQEGVSLLLRVQDGTITLIPPATALQRLKSLSSHVGHSLVDELSSDRENEALLEEKN